MPRDTPQTGFRLASYNIRKARGLDGKRRPARIIEVINGLNADVIALQEADRRMGDRIAALPYDLITQETDLIPLPIAQNDVSLGWHGNAILVRKSVKTVGVNYITLPGLEPRGAVSVDLDIGPGVTLIATHLGLLRSNRRNQLSEIIDNTGDRRNRIIAGDMNEWSMGRGQETLAADFAIHAPGATFHARRPVAALDRIATSHRVELRDAGVEQGPVARVASDHLPIWADLVVAT